MSQPTDPDWPLKGPRLAWGVPSNLVASSIPLTQSQLVKGVLTTEEYLAMLAFRVGWLLARADDPEEAELELAAELDRLGAWLGPEKFLNSEQAARAMLLDNPMFPDLFTAAVQLPSPIRVIQMPAAVQAVRETDLREWLDLGLQSPSDGPDLA